MSQPHGVTCDIPVAAAYIRQTIPPVCPPSDLAGSGAATPSSVAAGGTTLLTVTVTPGTNPTSTGITVNADLTAIGGVSDQMFYDDGTNGDTQGGDNVFSFSATVAAGTTQGGKNMFVSIADNQTRTANTSIALTITPGPTPGGTPQLSKEYIYSGSRMLAVEDANAQP